MIEPAIHVHHDRNRAAEVRRVGFVSLGCPKNLVDSETMLGMLRGSGLVLVADHDQADAVVINTCGFLDAAREESLEVIEEALERKRRGAISRVVVTGCLVQRHRARLLEWAPGIDAMIGVFDRDRIVEAVRGGADSSETRTSLPGADGPRYWIAGNALQAAKQRGLPTVGLTVNGRDGRGIGYFEDDRDRLRLTPRHYTYLRVSEGCNQACAFCTIPSIRGKMRSKPLDHVVAEAHRLMADGAFELNLIGQDTTSYGADIGYDDLDRGEGLVGLLTALNDAAADHGGGWVRLMYAYPTNFTDEMIDAIASLPNIVKYVDMPLQHISDRMLRLMRRRISRAAQEDLLYRLRERIQGLALRTTLITGFPGETDEDHQELLEFVEHFQFDALGVFRYSREPGTPAGTADLDPVLHVPDETKARREDDLMLAQQRLAFDNAAYLAEEGCQFDVLIDRPAPTTPTTQHTPGPDGTARLYLGRCYHQAPQVDTLTSVTSRELLSPGELVRCTITGADGYDLLARPTDQLERVTRLKVLK
jgi:ribosomal protein S12 methylthiotransferase